MEEIMYSKSYQDFKAELDKELKGQAESFVRTGYLLKVARDTTILHESGYSSVTEFAESEYGLSKTQVSRYMHINDKFSIDGYSENLLPQYTGFGYAKLSIMLQLPESINEELTPRFTKSEITAIKSEYDSEAKVTDIERMLEAPNQHETEAAVDEHTEKLYKAILQLGEDDPALYVAISDNKDDYLADALPDIMAPSGDKIYSIRVRGIGRLLLSISELSDKVKLINQRSGDKDLYTWADIAQAWIYAGILGKADEYQTGTECWEQRYERKCPVQQSSDTPKKEAKVSKAPAADWPSIYETGQKVKTSEGQIACLDKKTDDTGVWLAIIDGKAVKISESKFEEWNDSENKELVEDPQKEKTAESDDRENNIIKEDTSSGGADEGDVSQSRESDDVFGADGVSEETDIESAEGPEEREEHIPEVVKDRRDSSGGISDERSAEGSTEADGVLKSPDQPDEQSAEKKIAQIAPAQHMSESAESPNDREYYEPEKIDDPEQEFVMNMPVNHREEAERAMKLLKDAFFVRDYATAIEAVDTLREHLVELKR